MPKTLIFFVVRFTQVLTVQVVHLGLSFANASNLKTFRHVLFATVHRAVCECVRVFVMLAIHMLKGNI